MHLPACDRTQVDSGDAAVKITNLPPFRGADEIRIDHRAVGPAARCPVCENAWAQTVVTLDQETYQLSLVLLDVVCFECGALFRLATESDRIPREWPAPEVDE